MTSQACCQTQQYMSPSHACRGCTLFPKVCACGAAYGDDPAVATAYFLISSLFMVKDAAQNGMQCICQLRRLCLRQAKHWMVAAGGPLTAGQRHRHLQGIGRLNE